MNRTSDSLTEAAGTLGQVEEFFPRRFLRNGHLQTLVGNFRPRRFVLPAAKAHIIEVDAGKMNPTESTASGSAAAGRLEQAQAAVRARGASHVLCHCHWQPNASQSLTMVLVHGLEGSSRSQYVLGNSARAWAAGCNVVRMNMRNCGGTEDLSPTLYHSGLSADVAAVMQTLAAEKGLSAFALVGYSMGGNLVLKLAGEMGASAPDYLKAVVGVSPAMDLGASADALHSITNRIYEWKFLLGLRRRFRRKAELFPEVYSTAGLERVASLRQFDDCITARYSGFAGADDYYHRAASSRVVHQIAVPTLVLHAFDDPFVRMLPATRSALLANQQVELIETAHGGHCAFLAPAAGYDGYWAEKMLLDFLLSVSKSLMEADWSVALEAADPVIIVPWAASGIGAQDCRFIDLRLDKNVIDEIEEARTRPALRSALLLLNRPGSPLWTVKCDAWNSSAEEGAEPMDPYEMDAELEETAFGAGSYIDLLPHDPLFLSSFERQERWIRVLTKTLRSVPAKATRVELILRRAEINDLSGFGVTWFVEGCAKTALRANEVWTRALELTLPLIMDTGLM